MKRIFYECDFCEDRIGLPGAAQSTTSPFERLRKIGWVVVRDQRRSGQWQHKCPDCVAAEQTQQRKERGE